MANQYVQFPTGNANIYPTLGDFPSAAPTGTLAVAADSSIVYEFFLGSWQPVAQVGEATGTVISVGLSLPGSVFSISGSPVTTSGTLTGSFISQSANTVLAGPTSGGGAAPAFRALVAADLPVGSLSDSGTDGISITNGTNAVIGAGTTISQHVADASHNGYLSNTDWSTFNSKQSALTLGDLTDVGTDGIVITGGTGAVVGSGTSIAQHVADTTHNGYLSSTDWNTFNGKQAAGNYITALTGDATATGPGSVALTLATVNANIGSFGSSTAIPAFTVNAKGLIIAATSSAVIAPAGTLTGTTLASNVVSSSLTSVGTIATGVWQGTAIAPTYGGSSPVTRNLYVDGNRTDTYTPNGAINLPFKTITDAINQIITNGDNSSHGYTIQVAPAAYSETLTFNSTALYSIVINSSGGQSNSLQNTTVSGITSTSNNTQLATLVFIGITVNGAVNLTGNVNGTNFGSAQILFNNCTFNNASSTITFNNVNNINMYNSQIQGSGSVATYTNIAFSYMEGPEGFNNNTTLHMVDNPGGNVPSQYSGNYMLFYISKVYGTMTIDAGSEVDMLQSYAGSSSSITNNGTIHSWTTNWGGTVTLNNGSTMRTRADTFHTAPTVNAGASFLYQDTGYNDTQVLNTLKLTGATSGVISVLPQAAAGTYNFNMPTTAGTTGQVLTSQGGGSSAMTWTTPGTGSGTVTSVSVVTANGFAGTVATATTTPAITLTTSLTTPIIAGNGTALIAATTTGNGSTAVLSNNPAITGTWTLTDAGTIINAATASKVLKFDLSGMTAARTLTLTSAQSTTQSLAIPNITASDTLATLGLPQTFSAATTFSAASTALTVTNAASIGSLTLGSALPIASGGTGQVTASAAFNALAPATAKGGTIVGSGSNTYANLPVGTDGFVLTANSAATNGVDWEVSPSAISESSSIKNIGMAITASSNVLTIALKQADGSTDPSTGTAAVTVSMRNPTAATGGYNQRSVTAALSQTLSQGTTLGMLASQSNNLWVYLIDSDGSGTMKIGLSTVRMDEMVLQSSVAESVTGTVTIAAPGVWTSNGHGYNNGDAVSFTTTGALPTGLSINTKYFVNNSTTNTFQVGSTIGGASITTTGTQSGTHTIHNASSRLCSAAVYSSKPIRLIGGAAINNSTAGNWTTPTNVAMDNGSLLPEAVAVQYYAGTQTPGSGNVVNWSNLVFDTHGTVTTGAGSPSTGWFFTPPIAGVYKVSVQVLQSNATSTDYNVYKNGSQYSQLITATAASVSYGNSTAVKLAIGDYINVEVDAGGTLGNNTVTNYISINLEH